jgi:hypothetical protein
MMWRLPPLAKKHDVNLCLLSLRVIDRARVATPLAPLNYRPAVRKHLIDLRVHLPTHETMLWNFSLHQYRADATSVQRIDTPEGSHYLVHYAHGEPRQVPFTTPHLNIPLEEVARARQALARVYSTEQHLTEVERWGEGLFWTEWLAVQGKYTVPYDKIPDPKGGTSDEQMWLAWTVLRGDRPERTCSGWRSCSRKRTRRPRIASLYWAGHGRFMTS